jgi:hypothetical protein
MVDREDHRTSDFEEVGTIEVEAGVTCLLLLYLAYAFSETEPGLFRLFLVLLSSSGFVLLPTR